jgi:hypothetical protein
MTRISLPSERPFRMRVRDEVESLVPPVVKPLADVRGVKARSSSLLSRHRCNNRRRDATLLLRFQGKKCEPLILTLEGGR